MRAISVIVGAGAIGMIGATAVAGSTHASTYGIELNGQYLVTSNGDWAKTNDVYHDEKTVRQVWTIATSCDRPTVCTGHLTSSDGWDADINYTEDRWLVRRTVPNWQPCDDGSASPGNQLYMFWPTDVSGQHSTNNSLLAGIDTTKGISGACGKNLPLVITIPMRLQSI